MSARQRRLLPWLSLLVVYLVWGSTYMAIRIAVRWLPPFAAASLRFLTAGLVMSAVAAVADRAHGWPGPRQWADYALVGVLLLACGNAWVMWSEKRVPSGIAALIVATVPLWITLLDGLRPGGQAWTVRVWLGTLLGLAGVALVATADGGVGGPGSLGAGHWNGILALQAAALAWTIGSLYAQSVPRRVPIFTASSIEMLAGAVVLSLESRLAGEDLRLFVAAPREAWFALLYLAVFGSVVGFTAFAYCLNELPAPTVGTYAYVNPVVAVGLGAVFLGERLSMSLVGGAFLILMAVLLSTVRPKRAPAPAERSAAITRARQEGSRNMAEEPSPSK